MSADDFAAAIQKLQSSEDGDIAVFSVAERQALLEGLSHICQERDGASGAATAYKAVVEMLVKAVEEEMSGLRALVLGALRREA